MKQAILTILQNDNLEEFKRRYPKISADLSLYEYSMCCILSPSTSEIGKWLRAMENYGCLHREDAFVRSYDKLSNEFEAGNITSEQNYRLGWSEQTSDGCHEYCLFLISRKDATQLKHVKELFDKETLEDFTSFKYPREQLLEENIQDAYWRRSLVCFASATNNLACLKVLIEELYTANAKLNHSVINRCFEFAVKYGHEKICEYLLMHPDLKLRNVEEDISDPLFLSVANNHHDLTKQLLNLGADDSSRSVGKSIVKLCVEKNNYELIDHFISKLNSKYEKERLIEDALFYVAVKGTLELFKKLTSRKEFVYPRSNSERPLLHVATINENYPIVEALLDFGADVNERNKEHQLTLHLLKDNVNNPDVVKIITLFVKKGALINAQDNKGMTPMHFYWSNSSILKLLLEAGASVNIQENSNHNTVLHLAAKDSQLTYLELLNHEGLYQDIKNHQNKSSFEVFLSDGIDAKLSGILKSKMIGLPFDLIMKAVTTFFNSQDSTEGGMASLKKQKIALNESDEYHLLKKIALIYELAKNGELVELDKILEDSSSLNLNFVTEHGSLFHMLQKSYETKPKLAQKIRNCLIQKHQANPYVTNNKNIFAYEQCERNSPGFLSDFFQNESHYHLYQFINDAKDLLNKVFLLRKYPNSASEVNYTYVNRDKNRKIQLTPEQLVRLLHDEVSWLIETMSQQKTPVPKKLLTELNNLLPTDPQTKTKLQRPIYKLSSEDSDDLRTLIIYAQNIISLHYHEVSERTVEQGNTFVFSAEIQAKDRFIREHYPKLIPVEEHAPITFFMPC